MHTNSAPIPRSSFNDDDYYVYWPDTLQLAAHYSCKTRRPVPLPGQVVELGLAAKNRGLWK
jgi:hypothetical protein